MIKGLYAAASAMVAGEHRQKLIAHNAANMDTPGFKEIMTTMDDFIDTRANFLPGADQKAQAIYVGDLGLGVETMPDTTDYSEAAFENTGHNLDFAIGGPGFFRIQTPAGERLTRDGRFLKDAQGNLTTVEGFKVLDSAGKPIRLADGDISVNTQGAIFINNQAAGQLGISVFQNPDQDLVRDENNKFIAKGQPTTQVAVSVQQGFLEGSNVNAAELTTQMVTVARQYEAAQKMVTTQDDLLAKSIGTLGRGA